MRQADGLLGVVNPRAWLFHVARNLLIERYRASKDEVPLEEDAFQAPEIETIPVEAPSA